MKLRPHLTSFFCGALATVALLSLGGPALAARQRQATLQYTGVRVTLDGKALELKDEKGASVEPFVLDGTTYLPVRAIAGALGLEVDWDQASQTVALSTDKQAPTKNAAPQTEGAQLRLKVTDCNVRFELTDGDAFEHEVDEKTCTVASQVAGKVTTLTVTSPPSYRNSTAIQYEPIRIVRIPKSMFSSIVLEGEDAGVSLPALDVDYDITMEDGAVGISLPRGYTKTLRYTATDSAASLNLKPGTTDYSLTLNSTDSAVSLPAGWEAYQHQPSYTRVQGSGAAQLELTIQDSAFTITEE